MNRIPDREPAGTHKIENEEDLKIQLSMFCTFDQARIKRVVDYYEEKIRGARE